MTSLIKNQVLKHLTKFFKDLAPEQLQLSAFKGSCELSNLQLEEKVLMDLLSFPAWIHINKATCDQLSIKIPWTKIKSVPIQMNLNEVLVEVEVCEEFRDVDNESDELNLSSLINTAQTPGKYGFVDRVIDGITVTVNSVLITFKSKLMVATFNLSRVILESRCPNWKPGELSLTRIKDVNRGQILLFKIVEWQTMRLEAKSLSDTNQAPLRLITNHAQCRLTIKKNLDDCSVIAARIFVIFEDILWVLTFAQFISAASFVEYIFTLIKKSPVSKKSGLLDSQTVPSNGSLSTSVSSSAAASSSIGPHQAAPLISPLGTPVHSTSYGHIDRQPVLTGNMSSASLLEQKFLCYDLFETSLHLFIEKVDAHLYDDIEVTAGSCTQRDSGGALQTTFDQIQVDCYPYSRAISDRKHWYRWFDPSPQSRRQWLNSHFSEFDLILIDKMKNLRDETLKKFAASLDDPLESVEKEAEPPAYHIPTASNEQLLSLTLLIRVKDYCMNCVATKHTVRGSGLNKFIQTDKDYHMPSDMPAFYLELDYFYYFDNVNRMMIYDDVPDPLAFMHLSPTKLLFDPTTLIFLNSFQLNLSKALEHLNDLFPDDTSAPKIHCRFEILMPQISLPAKAETPTAPDNESQSKPYKNDKPTNATSTLMVKSGKVTLSNSIYDKNIQSKLIETIEKLRENPSQPINFSSGGQTNASRKENSCVGEWANVWNPSLIKNSHGSNVYQQLWAIQFEPVWMDFLNYDVDNLNSGQRLEPIVEPVDAYAFIHFDLLSPQRQKQQQLQLNSASNVLTGSTTTGIESDQVGKSDMSPKLSTSNNQIIGNNKRDTISVLATVMDGSILANMDKVQFGFLQRLGMHVEKLFQQIRADASSVIQMDTTIEGSLELNLTAYIKDIKARLILDKKIEKQRLPVSCCDTNVSSNSISNKLAKMNPFTLDQMPASRHIGCPLVVEESNYVIQSGDTKSFQSINNNSDSSKCYISAKPTVLLNPYELKIQPTNATHPELIALEKEDDCELDECIEVGDDASCLLFTGNTSLLSTGHTSEPSISGPEKCKPIEALQPPEQKSLTTDRRSPIEESLLISFDEMEQSSALFAKVGQKPRPAAPLGEDPDTDRLNNEESDKDERRQGRKQQFQEFETESISYLELSMSQLMVRRITETKRKHKF